MGYAGKLDDVTIKSLQQNSFLLIGVGQHTSSQLSSSETTPPPHAKAHTPSNNAVGFGIADLVELLHRERVRVRSAMITA